MQQSMNQNYAYNSQLSPAMTPEEWAQVFWTAVARMEPSLKREETK